MLEIENINVENGVGKIGILNGDVKFELSNKIELSDDEIKQKLKKNSLTLLLSRNLFISKSFIDIPEKQLLLNFAKSENRKENILLLTGTAGSGKTALLSEVQQILNNENTMSLSIKSDSLVIESKESLNQHFEISNLYESIINLSKKEKIIILVDQLDALSLTLTKSREPIHILLEFIQSLKGIENINIIISVREYDLKNDPLLKQINNCNVITMGLLSEGIVKSKVQYLIEKHGAMSGTLLALLKTPLNLALFLELDIDTSSFRTIKTLQGLYELFWKQKILDQSIKSKLKVSSIKLIDLIVNEMSDNKKIEVSEHTYSDKYYKEIRFLASNNIIIQKDSKLSFFHQTFYDYIFSRNFIKYEKSFYKYIIQKTNQGIEVREVFKQIIEFLRGTDTKEYLKQLEKILYSNKIRFHIKLLVISYLGSIDKVTDKEFNFLQKLFKKDNRFIVYFIEGWTSSSWLEYFYNAGYFNKKYLEKYNLKYKPEIFINTKTDLVLEILEKFPDIKNKIDVVLIALTRLNKWNKTAFELFKNTIAKREEIKKSTHWYYNTLERLIEYDVEYVFERIFYEMNNEVETFENMDKRDLFSDHELFGLFEKLLEKEPLKTIKLSLKLIDKIIKKTISPYRKRKNYLLDDLTFGEVSHMSNYDGNLYQIWSFYKKIFNEVLKIAKHDKDSFLEIFDSYDKKYVSIVRFLIFGYSQDLKMYKNEIYELLTNKFLLEELSFNDDVGYELKKILKKSFCLFNRREKEIIVNTLKTVNPRWEIKHFWERCSGNLRGLKQYEYLLQLPFESLKEFSYFKEFQELERKFPNHKELTPHKSSGGLIETPLKKEVYEKMNLEDWKQSMIIYGKKTLRKSDDFMKGDISQNSRQFEEEVKAEPDKFYNFLFEIRNDVSGGYLANGLNGLVQANYDSNQVINLIKVYYIIQNQQLQLAILRIIRNYLEKDIFDNIFIDIFEKYIGIEYENLDVESEDKSIDGYISTTINSIQGVYAESIPLIIKFLNKKNKKRIILLTNELIATKHKYILFGLLMFIGELSKNDIKLNNKIIDKILKTDDTGIFSLYLANHLHIMRNQKILTTKKLYKYLEKAINYIELSDDDKRDREEEKLLGCLLFYYYLKNTKNNYRLRILKRAIKSSDEIVNGILIQAFKCEIKSNNKNRIEFSKKYILKFRNNLNVNWHYEHFLKELTGLGLIDNDFKFISKLAESKNIQKSVYHFCEYLKNEYYQSPILSDKILILIKIFLTNSKSEDVNYSYRDNELIEFIIELYIRIKKSKKKEECLNLIDEFLISDRYRNSVVKLLEK